MKLRALHASSGQTNVTDGHDDQIVELTRVAFIAEAIAIKQDLELVGIHAAVFESDAGGWAPHFGIEQGNRVMVRAQDLAKAHQLLSDDGGQQAVEQIPPSATFDKHLRRHSDT
ncbi:MAG: hypothetical protein QOJ52_1248 [Acidimicrobiaceae bacterium]|jgi:hypothetical protein|nr:hypothetical protein [Acidimicrobiaceae bacterium]MDQ1419286.1 hypothetical protein [Acidimicrobiaceae bacterium]